MQSLFTADVVVLVKIAMTEDVTYNEKAKRISGIQSPPLTGGNRPQ